MAKEQEKTNTEQLILEAAEQEFFTKGYNGARTISIAERAGITHAMLHYYFRTKEQLFECVLDKNISYIAATVLSALGKSEKSLLDRLEESITAHFDLIAGNPLLPLFIFNEVISRPERYEIMLNKLSENAKEIFEQTQAGIDELHRQGSIEWIDARMLFMSIVSMNIFPFIAYPFAERMMGDLMTDREAFLEKRKAENVETIMRRLKKQ